MWDVNEEMTATKLKAHERDLNEYLHKLNPHLLRIRDRGGHEKHTFKQCTVC